MEQDQILGFNGMSIAEWANDDENKENDNIEDKRKKRKRKGKTKDY